MDGSKLQRGEFIAIAGGALLCAGLFLPWYTTKGLGRIDAMAGPRSGWDVHPIMRYFLLLAAVAPLVLAYIILRDHALSWPRGELTAVIAIAGFGLLFYNGLIAQPGTSNQLTSLQLGWAVAVLGTLLMLSGSALRSSQGERKRKPPGTL
ncbi:MAG: hypothetical protein M3417_14790 [Actinomycetota bacterium]|nr:hypothetical protein [Actinomycetota bacterium]